VIDGKAHAVTLRTEVAAEVGRIRRAHGIVPGLAAILVGGDAASEIYVRSKSRHATACGFQSVQCKLPAETAERDLVKEIARLNVDPSIHGILVQLPLPPQIDPRRVIESIAPAKDVDGFTFANIGRLASNTGGCLVPCTPAGVLRLIKAQLGPNLAGRDVLVIGASNIVGRPMAELLLHERATVTIAHSCTRDLPALCARAEIVVAAIGQPRFVQGHWFRRPAFVFDVGINRIAAPELGPGRTRLVGDVDFHGAIGRVAGITPVPGGIGPMTIAMLLSNTLEACQRRLTLPE
jgi:methylenetetrahydrofolate dehydrogenase (NADP+)/methenyltetrahydrofolate cyclohydrolase